MGVSYVGSKTATNDPNGAPEPNRSPAATIPVDLDGDSASTHQPGEKAQMDWADWLRAPVAKLVEYANGAIKRYRNAKIQARWGIDHMGFPAGRLHFHRDNIESKFSESAATEVSGVGGYEIKLVGTSPALTTGTPDAIGRKLTLSPGNAATDYTIFKTLPFVTFNDDTQIAMEWICNMNAQALGSVFAGLSDTFAGSPTGIVGIYFEATDTDANIQAQASGAVKVDTGIAKGAAERRFRIEFYGLNTDENAVPARRAVFYIDGVKVAEMTGFGTVVGSTLAAAYFASLNDSGQPSLSIRGPILWGCNVQPGDVF